MGKAGTPLSTTALWQRTLRRAIGALAGLVLLLSFSLQATGQPATPPAPSAPAATGSIPAARFAKNVVIITIDREIDGVMARSVERRLKAAAENKAEAVVFELDTPGGEVGAVMDISGMIKRSTIPNTVAWVHNQAYSGGALIAIACREIVVSETARLGDAAPIVAPRVIGGRKIMSLSETERQKILAPLLADVVDSARRRGHDEKLVQGMLALGVELWMIENTQTGERVFIDRAEHKLLFGEPPDAEPLALASVAPMPVTSGGAAPTDQPPPSADYKPQEKTDFIPAGPGIHDDTARATSLALSTPTKRPVLSAADAGKWRKLEKVSDGNAIFTFTEAEMLRFGLASSEIRNDEQLTAFFGASHLRRLDQSWSESMVLFLTNFIVRGILIVIFLVALFIEMTHPGVLIPGIVACVAFVLLVAPPLLNNMASWWEVAAMLLGVVFLILEIFVLPGFGICGVAGIVLFLVGLVGTFIGAGSGGLFPDSPGAKSELMSGVTTVVLSAATAGVVMWFIAKHFGSLPLLNKLVLQDDTSGSSEGLLAAMGPVDRPVDTGDLGVALTPLRPAGRVQIGEQIVDVVSDFGFIRAGAQVRVVAVDQFRITVEPVNPGLTTGPGGGSAGNPGSDSGGRNA